MTRMEAFGSFPLDEPGTPASHTSRPSFESLLDDHANSRFPEAYRDFQLWRSRIDSERGARRAEAQPQASLDNDSTRPEPLAEGAMTVKMECKICFAQISNHALLPCGEWFALN